MWNKGVILVREYIIKKGDSFFHLAHKNGCCWQDISDINPGVDPCCLQVGQKIMLPIKEASSQTKCSSGCADAAAQGYKGRCDDVIVEVEGVKFRVTRVGEASVPHEVHLILPRTEIHRVEHPGSGIIETSIMLSNINIVNSPRLQGEGETKK